MSRFYRISLLARPGLRWLSDAPGKGGGGSGSVRAAGGKFSEREQALEDQYFKRKEREQLERLKDHLEEAAEHHEEEIVHHKDVIKNLKDQIKRHEEKIERHKGKLHSHKKALEEDDD